MKNKLYYPILFMTMLLLFALITLAGCGKKSSDNRNDASTTIVLDETIVNNSAGDEPETDYSDALPGNTSSAMGAGGETTGEDDADDVETDDYYHDYRAVGGEVAFVTSVSEIDDEGFNTSIYDGVKRYSQSAGVTYSYYIPASDTLDAYRETVTNAISTGGKLIVCAGVHYAKVVGEFQSLYPDTSFLLIDTVPCDADGNPCEILSNVSCASFKEEEAGYLAGYMAVMEGYTQLGFMGGENVEPVAMYGYGYLQGINDAALLLEKADEVSVNYYYCNTFIEDESITQMANSWYEDGTEVIFSCGGSIIHSILEAAKEHQTMIIGVDINQNDLSPYILTSAMKGIDRAVVTCLDDYFAYNHFSEEFAGQLKEYGCSEWCSDLPSAPWRFRNVTLDDYDALYARMREGSIKLPASPDQMPNVSIKVYMPR